MNLSIMIFIGIFVISLITGIILTYIDSKKCNNMDPSYTNVDKEII